VDTASEGDTVEDETVVPTAIEVRAAEIVAAMASAAVVAVSDSAAQWVPAAQVGVPAPTTHAAKAASDNAHQSAVGKVIRMSEVHTSNRLPA
jgi:hypothetical protein